VGAIATNYDSYAYGVDTSSYAASSTSANSGEFDAILASQMSDDSQAAASSSADAADQLALSSYDSGQQTAYALSLDSGETTSYAAAAATDTTVTDTAAASDTTSTEETTTSEGPAVVNDGEDVEGTEEVDEEEEILVASGAGWPGDGTYMAAWTPSGMQFYDELSGQWIDDNIPHRINENGDLEYNWEGNWYLDTATRHRMMVDGEYVEVDGEASEGESTQTASAQTTLDESGPFEAEYYYNADLAQWKIFNFPTREDEEGNKEYYWQDQWWTDNWDHDYAAASTEQAAA
jgi:hypothetical protein